MMRIIMRAWFKSKVQKFCIPFESRVIRYTAVVVALATALAFCCSFAEASPRDIGATAIFTALLGTIFWAIWLILLGQFVFDKPVTGKVLSRHNTHRWRKPEDQRYWLVVRRPVVGPLTTHLSVPVSDEMFWNNRPGDIYTGPIPDRY